MRLTIGYGKRPQPLTVGDENLLGVLAPNAVEASLTGEAEVKRALQNPIGTGRLRDLVKPGEKIAIVTSDITRPVPSSLILPSVLDELYLAGVKAQDITVVFALGSHRVQTDWEKRKLAGERAYNEVRLIDGDVNDCVRLGETSRGTPIDITRAVAEADRRVCLGNIEYHYFAGYSGGAKAIMPGVATRDTIQANHRRMIEPGAVAGELDHNPLRQDIEEVGKFCPIDFIVNVVLDEHKQIINAVAGHAVEAHRAGCRFLDKIYAVAIERRADIVIASQGGSPKDLNLYQTQKALDNAKHAVRDGGVIILVGACGEGLGEETFEQWLIDAEKPSDLIERIKKDFRLGGHKAAAIAMVLERADVYLVSDMEPEFVKRIFLTPFSNVQDALDAAIRKLGPASQVLVMPYAGSTLPKLICKEAHP